MTYLFDQKKEIRRLNSFFSANKSNLHSFGKSVNQTFEAYVFAKTIQHYMKNGWQTTIVNPPKSKKLRLKFTTRGAPINFSYCVARKGREEIQIRHQLRVDIAKKYVSQTKPANICCDIVVMENTDISHYKTYHSLPNASLIAFGEVKHMSAFAELVAGFIGMVHELSPSRLKRIRIKSQKKNGHLAPFLYVSGIMYVTAQGIVQSIQKRKYDIDVYSHEKPI